MQGSIREDFVEGSGHKISFAGEEAAVDDPRSDIRVVALEGGDHILGRIDANNTADKLGDFGR